jgi:hypothetical protein
MLVMFFAHCFSSVQHRALDKEALALTVVDGRGMRNAADKDDYKMWTYESPNTPPDAPSVIECSKQASDREQMEKILADAAEHIGSNIISKIQGLDVLLSEDAGMKVNKRSEQRVLLMRPCITSKRLFTCILTTCCMQYVAAFNCDYLQ